MRLSLDSPPTAGNAAVADCWNRIGVRGDSSCVELQQLIHCRSCPVYAAAAARQLDVEPPADYLTHWTQQVAQANALSQQSTLSALIFRVGEEWLALPTRVLNEIASLRTVHSIPQRRDGVVTGLTNIRGELLVCVSLQRIVGAEARATNGIERHEATTARLLVLQQDDRRIVCPVDQVHGVERYGLHELTAAPATVGKAATSYTRALLVWKDRSVGLLDEARLFDCINRSLA
jgi:chemotaxis-related protein WspD